MNTTRHNAFETNSSSSHSLTLNMNQSGLNIGQLQVIGSYFSETHKLCYANCIVLFGGDFGWGPEHHYDAQTKASYIAVYAHYLDNSSKQELLGRLLKVIKRACPNAEELVCEFSLDYGSGNWSYIDHQSLEGGNIIDDLNDDQMFAFIFNTQSELIIDNDNHE